MNSRTIFWSAESDTLIFVWDSVGVKFKVDHFQGHCRRVVVKCLVLHFLCSVWCNFLYIVWYLCWNWPTLLKILYKKYFLKHWESDLPLIYIFWKSSMKLTKLILQNNRDCYWRLSFYKDICHEKLSILQAHIYIFIQMTNETPCD